MSVRRTTPQQLAPTALLILTSITGLGACDGETPREGLYYWGAEVHVICRCGRDLCFWVRGEPEVVEPLKQYVQKQTDRPYQPVHILYRGHELDEPTAGFAASYDGYEAVVEVLSITAELPEHCPAP
jgi:hypothetical protein